MKRRQGIPASPAIAGLVAAGMAIAVAMPALAQVKVPDTWITVVAETEAPDLDACNSSRAFVGRIVKQNVAETLIEKSPLDGSLMPRLATSWESTAPNVWRLKLRQGVTFQDGAPFNAAAVKTSLERTTTSKINCSSGARYFPGLKLEITALDDSTVQIASDKPDPIMPIRLAGVAISSPNTPFDKLVLTPIGTGPYVMESWTPGQQILMKRNDKYWGKRPEIEGVQFITRKESSVRAAMVKLGEADLSPNIAAPDAKDPELDHSYLSSDTTFLRIDTMRAPLTDKRVRLALNYAVDRESLRGSVVSKDVLHATQMVGPWIPGHNHDLDKMVRPYDPAKARALIAEAKADGVAVNNEIEIISTPAQFPDAGELGESLLAMYQAVGLNVKLKNIELGGYYQFNYKPFAEDRGPTLFLTQHDNNNGDPVFSMFNKYACDGNSSMLCIPEFDRELERVTGLGGQERVDGWRKIFRTLYEDVVPEVWLYHMVGYARVGKRINFTPDISTGAELLIQNITFKK